MYCPISKETRSDEAIEFNHNVTFLSPMGYELFDVYESEILEIAQKHGVKDKVVKALRTFGKNYYLNQSYDEIKYSTKLSDVLCPSRSKKLVEQYSQLQATSPVFTDGFKTYTVCVFIRSFCLSKN